LHFKTFSAFASAILGSTISIVAVVLFADGDCPAWTGAALFFLGLLCISLGHGIQKSVYHEELARWRVPEEDKP
jgi:hypothetical protein